VDPSATVVVVASDHGESLGEHGEATHGLLCYGATMDVPLVLAGPGVPAGRTEERTCGLADIAPTLRRLCGLAPRPGDGRDLLDLPPERVLCGESLYAFRRYGWAQQACATDGRFSLIDGGPRLELFDRALDPGEIRPLPDPAGQEAYGRLDRPLLAYRERRVGGAAGGETWAAAASPYGAVVIPAAEFSKPAENRARRDAGSEGCREAIALLDRANEAIRWGRADVVGALVPRLRELEELDPGNPAPSLALGRALLLVLREPAGAARALERARQRGYETPDLRKLLEGAYRAAGDEDGLRRLRQGDGG
jgi:hypothetical protein